MNIDTAKQIPISDYLHSLGYNPIKQQGNSLWYKSPFRAEKEPSFKVNTDLNLWFDFGLGKGGNILSLAKELYSIDSLPYLLEKIASQSPHIRPVNFSFRKQRSEPSFQHLEVCELSHPALLRYLQGREINVALAKIECKELHFTNNGKPFFAIGFPNVAGGYEVRNSFSRGALPLRTSPIYGNKENQKIPASYSRVLWIIFHSLPYEWRNRPICLALTGRIISYSTRHPKSIKPLMR